MVKNLSFKNFFQLLSLSEFRPLCLGTKKMEKNKRKPHLISMSCLPLSFLPKIPKKKKKKKPKPKTLEQSSQSANKSYEFLVKCNLLLHCRDKFYHSKFSFSFSLFSQHPTNCSQALHLT